MQNKNEYIGYEITRGNCYYRGIVKAYKWNRACKALMHRKLGIVIPAKPYYMGRGFCMDEAIAKHGVEAFERKIIARFDNLQDAEAWEVANVVMQDDDPLSYNINSGGKKGFKVGKRARAKMTGENNPNYGKCGKESPSFGRKKSAQEIAKISGKNNGMFGKFGADSPKYKHDIAREPNGRRSRAKYGRTSRAKGAK